MIYSLTVALRLTSSRSRPPSARNKNNRIACEGNENAGRVPASTAALANPCCSRVQPQLPDQIDGRSPLAAVRPACGSVSVTAPRDDGTELSDSEGFVALTRQAACDGANHGRKDTD